MGRFVGGIFGNTYGSDTSIANTSGVFSMSDQYYAKQEGGWEYKLGETQANPGTSAEQVRNAGSTIDGYYWIQSSGMASAHRIWCDMTDGDSGTSGVGGWNRFWWYGTYEQNGAAAPGTFPTGDVFGTADISTITHTNTHGFGRIPSGVTPSWLMVKAKNQTITANGARLRYAIWEFDSGNTTAMRAKASMQSGTVADKDQNPYNNWTVSHDSSGNGNFPYGDFDSWWYGDHWQSSRGRAFNLDDDNHYGNTAFAAGYDHGGELGVDAFTGNDRNREDADLVLYWK